MSDKLMIDLCQEWIDGTAKPVACGYGPDGPNVQVDRANGDTAVICLRSVAEALVNSHKHSGNIVPPEGKDGGIIGWLERD